MPGNGEVWSLVFDFLTRRTVRIGARAVVLAAVVGGAVIISQSGKNVTLVLDGTEKTVQAEADDVRGLLRDEGVQVSDRDQVAPPLATKLHDGDHVVVRYARPLTITVDGVPRTYWTTELTVDSALRSLGIRADRARLSASRSESLGRRGLSMVLSNPKNVTVVADGRTRSVTTTDATVADLLRTQGITQRPLDQLSVLPNSPVVEGLVVALTRIDRQRVTVAESVPPGSVEQPTSTLDQGTRQVVTEGRPGTRSATYQMVLADGKVTSKTLVSAVVVTPPTAQVVQVGTRRAAPSGGGGSVAGADGLNWAALARCESGGNPAAVNPAGYYGLYQFSVSTWQSVGGSGLPSQASPSEQLYRAKLLYQKAGAGQWGCGPHLFD